MILKFELRDIKKLHRVSEGELGYDHSSQVKHTAEAVDTLPVHPRDLFLLPVVRISSQLQLVTFQKKQHAQSHRKDAIVRYCQGASEFS